MELLLSFLGGLALSATVAFFLARSVIRARDAAHKDAMEALQKRFDETVARVSAQLKEEAGEMLKARQKEFSESSNQSLGQIVNRLADYVGQIDFADEQNKSDNYAGYTGIERKLFD